MTGEAVLNCSDVTIVVSEGLFSRIKESPPPLPMLEAVTGKVLHMEILAAPLLLPLLSPFTRRTVAEGGVLEANDDEDVTAVRDVGVGADAEVSLMVVGKGLFEEADLLSLRV